MPGAAVVYRTGGAAEEQVVEAAGYMRMTMNSQPRDKQGLRDALRKAKSEIEKVEKAKKDLEEKKKKAEEEAKKAAEEKKDSPAPATPAPSGPAPTPGPQPQPGPVPSGGTPAPTGGAAKPGEQEPKVPEIDPAYKPLADLLEKKAGAPNLMLEIGRSSDVLHAMEVLADFEAVKPMYFLGGLPGGADYNYIVGKLSEAKGLVVMPPMMHRLPQTVKRYNTAGELMFAGLEVAYVPLSDAEAELENYREKAADIGRWGCERAATLRALTLNPAKAAGLEKQLGTIEKGKDADLVFLSGDPLDPGSRVTRVMILGKVAWDEKKEVAR